MAVTKTHPIKSTLKAAIDYICNPDKTDGKLLVSSFGCSAETADIEFAWTRRHAIDKGTNLGRHLIQAFEPGEVTPEEAHRIGMELAREVLGGKYEFVLTTHIDKDHVHNHLIFNAVSFQDHKHYHSNKRSYHFIRRTVTGSAKNTACLSSSPAGTRARATSSIRRNRTAPATRRSCAPPSTGSCPAALTWRPAPPPPAEGYELNGASTYPPGLRARRGSPD